MPKKKVEAKSEVKETKASEVSVYDGEKLVRVYSKKEHGADFQELAASFASKHNYQVK